MNESDVAHLSRRYLYICYLRRHADHVGIVQKIKIIGRLTTGEFQPRAIGFVLLFFKVVTVRIVKSKNRLNKKPRRRQGCY